MASDHPNNPYAQPQGWQPGYGHPGEPGAPRSMPGLMQTARVFLFIVGGFQGLVGMFYLFVAAYVDDASRNVSEVGADASVTGDYPLGNFSGIGGIGVFATGIAIFVALIALALSTLSITLGVKFSQGGQGVRITTIVYAGLATLIGVLAFINNSLGLGSSLGFIISLPWFGFGGTMVAAMVVPSGNAWFNRPRY